MDNNKKQTANFVASSTENDVDEHLVGSQRFQ